MTAYLGNSDQRGQPRVNVEFPATVSVGSQLSVKAQIKDLSLNSAFVRIKNNLYLSVNDEIGISIQCAVNDTEVIQGLARISRMVPGEGFVIYFTSIDENSLKLIKKILQKSETPSI